MTAASTRTPISWITILDYFRYLLFAWLGIAAASAIFILVMHVLDLPAVKNEVGSIWAYVTHAAPWFIAGLGGYYGYWAAPVYVGHGRTRKEAAWDGLVALAVLVVAAALLIISGFLLESPFLGFLGWSRHIPEVHSFVSHSDVLGMLNTYVPSLLLAGAAGAFVGALAYRYGSWGWLSLIPALGFIVIYALSVDGAVGFSLWERSPASTGPVFLAWLAGLLLAGLALLFTWLALRHTPVHSD